MNVFPLRAHGNSTSAVQRIVLAALVFAALVHLPLANLSAITMDNHALRRATADDDLESSTNPKPR